MDISLLFLLFCPFISILCVHFYQYVTYISTFLAEDLMLGEADSLVSLASSATVTLIPSNSDLVLTISYLMTLY